MLPKSPFGPDDFPLPPPSLIRLPSGLTLVLEQLPWAHTAALSLIVGAGSAHDAPNHSGSAHCLEHLLFKGTRSRSARQLMEAVEARGGYLNASTGRENTSIYARIPAPHALQALEILADIILNPTLADLQRERTVIIDEILAAQDNPEELVQDLITEFHWPGHPLGRPILGTLESVATLSRRHLAAFFRRYYTPSNMVLSIAGMFDPAPLAEAAAALFGPQPQAPPPRRPAPPQVCPGPRLLRRPLTQGHLCLAFPAPSLHNPDRYAYALLAQLLGGGSTSRLFDRIREREGLAYSVYAWHQPYSNAGVLGIYLAAAPNAAPNAARLLFEELSRLLRQPPDLQELNIAREQIIASLLMARESCSDRAAHNAAAILDYGRLIPLHELLQHYEQVTPENLAECAARTFRADQCAMLVLGPPRLRSIARIDLP